MSYEVCWDETWTRVDPGYYTNDRGMEIIRTGPATWTLSYWVTGEDDLGSRHRTLRAAKAAADLL
jgi:hypothetical protein